MAELRGAANARSLDLIKELTLRLPSTPIAFANPSMAEGLARDASIKPWKPQNVENSVRLIALIQPIRPPRARLSNTVSAGANLASKPIGSKFRIRSHGDQTRDGAQRGEAR